MSGLMAHLKALCLKLPKDILFGQSWQDDGADVTLHSTLHRGPKVCADFAPHAAHMRLAQSDVSFM